ncbi:hypothetical protein AC578_7823 [Pseudocercospora eumusae]|uniref:Uncharacterized protein n=1 Tax=Pseudocercospora eumusae TaxID=321146 RepID=A0A139HJ57_9PEZI|nr:hypothetical protein AC578_7823 [Pseudocercospora eumusae]
MDAAKSSTKIAQILLQMETTTSSGAEPTGLTSAMERKETGVEIKAVDEQASSILDTVNGINGQLDAAKTLRKQKSRLLSSIEKRLIDSTLENTEKTLTAVAGLVEGQVSMSSNSDDINAATRVMSVLSDFPLVPVSLSQLSLASQPLQTALNILRSRACSPYYLTSRSMSDPNLPPTYEESQFLTESRTKNILRKESSNITSNSKSELQPHHSDSTSEGFLDFGELESPPGCFANAPSPGRKQDELFLGNLDARAQHTSPAHRYIPYQPGFSSPSTLSLDSRTNTPSVLVPGPSYVNPSLVDVHTDGSKGSRSHSLPDLSHNQIASQMKHEALKRTSPAVSVVDGFEETQQRMAARSRLESNDHDTHYAANYCSEEILQRTLHRCEVGTSAATQTQEAAIPSKPQPECLTEHGFQPLVRWSLPTLPPSIHPRHLNLAEPPSRPPPLPPAPARGHISADNPPKQLELPLHVTAHQPALSMPDLQARTNNAVKIHSKQSSLAKNRDWESLPSQLRRGPVTSTFVFPCKSPELSPRPLFHNMVKPDVSQDFMGPAEQIRSPAKSSQPCLESEFPEVVIKSTLPVVIRPPSPCRELPGLVLQESDACVPEPVTIVTEVSADLLKRARTRRQRDAQCYREGDAAPELALPNPSTQAPEPLSTTATGIVKKKPPPVPSKPRRALKSTSSSSLASSTVSTSVCETASAPSRTEAVSGRARSQRWRELQFERSQLLPNSMS